MTGWKISEFGKLETHSSVEELNSMDGLKVRITRSLITEDDIALICGEDKSIQLPIIPGRMAIGMVTKLSQPSSLIKPSEKVVIASTKPCGKCAHCIEGKTEKCYEFSIAGRTVDGFLKDFVTTTISEVYPLPQNVKDEDAIYIEYIALALSAIDKLNFEKGDHVAVIGGSVFGSIVAQLLSYYQAVPIIVDDNENSLQLAKKSGIYYSLPVNSKTEREISVLTGGKMVSGVVYATRSGIGVDLAYRVSAPGATVVFAGFSYPNIKPPINLAMNKELTSVCVSSGHTNYRTAINILANKGIDLSLYHLTAISVNEAESKLNEMISAFNKKEPFDKLLINMLG